MREIGHILLAMDFSEAADQLAEYARLFAEKFEARITVLYVAPTMNRYGKLYVPANSIDQLAGQILDGAKRAMSEFMERHFAGIKADGLVEYGYAPEKILEVAEELEAGLIIMGTHGRVGVDRILFGSVAEKVVKMATIPVVTVRPV
ncbi:universal stress protein family [hydrocarbon metagenome]|uniref:Universal stress protein family n=1 Tax=hydrocarbon metagenome TaxID=938273 RepID=A0A0W8G884_9ZZZZ